MLRRLVTDRAHIVLVHRYFWPDTPPYAAILADISATLVAARNRVTVITAQPSYGDSANHDRAPRRERLAGADVRRLWLLPERKDQPVRRALNLVMFSLKVLFRILTGPKPDVVMAATTPPILVALAASLGARVRGARFIYHNQDIYPEVIGTPTSAVARAVVSGARCIDIRIGRTAAQVVVLSSDMARTWQERGLARDRITVINNFDPTRPDLSARVAAPEAGKRRIVFAGNIGHFQDVPALISAVENHPAIDVELIIVGDGPDLAHCKSVAGPKTTFVGRTSAGEAGAWVRSSQLAVVSLHPGLYRYVYPSKTLGYLASATPLLVRIERESELATMVGERGIGWVAPPDEPCALATALTEFSATADGELAAMRERIQVVSAEHESSTVLALWVDMFAEVVGP